MGDFLRPFLTRLSDTVVLCRPPGRTQEVASDRAEQRMKFLHAADVHLDTPLRGLARHDDAPADTLRGASRKAFENLVELATNEEVDFVLIAGDLFDGSNQDVNTGVFLSRQLGILERAEIPVFLVVGNHDAESKVTKAVDTPSNLTVFPANKPKTEFPKDLGVAIQGQSFRSKSVEENLAAGYPEATPGLFNIGLLHTSLDGREGHASYAPCKLDDLRAKHYGYWALGHVHRAETVLEDPWVVFPGCLQGRHARETGAKGCCLVTVEDGQVQGVEWRYLDVVRWASVEVELGEVDSLEGLLKACRETLSAALDEADGRALAARIRLIGSTVVHPELLARAHWIRQRLVELAAGLGGDELWLEKVKIETSPKLDREELLAGDSALGRLARAVVEVPEDASELPGLEKVLEKLKAKLPREVLAAGDDGLDLADGAVLARLIREAKELLLGKLLEAGGEG